MGFYERGSIKWGFHKGSTMKGGFGCCESGVP